MKPTVGRMVYYKSRGSADGKYPSVDRAAVVTDVRGTKDEITDPLGYVEVRLCVMNPEGLFFTDWLTQGQNGGQWDWMPFQKDQQARVGYGTVNEAATSPDRATDVPGHEVGSE